MRRACRAIVLAAAFALLASIQAFADSASISVRDAGARQMDAAITVTSTTCSSSGYCGWFAVAFERHPTLGCSYVDEAFLVWVGPLKSSTGTVQETVRFSPFFPRRDKLCVFVYSGDSGPHPVGEATFDLPPGYGRQPSSGYNCSDFAYQRRAQYYLLLYPHDPSGLDADNDGAACEGNECPCGAEPIPPEPASQPTPPSPPPGTPTSPGSPVKLKHFKVIYYPCLKEIGVDLDLSFNGRARWQLDFFKRRRGPSILDRSGRAPRGGFFDYWGKPPALKVGKRYFARVTVESLGPTQQSRMKRLKISRCGAKGMRDVARPTDAVDSAGADRLGTLLESRVDTLRRYSRGR